MKDGCGYQQLTEHEPICDENCEECKFTITEIDKAYLSEIMENVDSDKTLSKNGLIKEAYFMKEAIETKIEELVNYIINKQVEDVTLDDYTILTNELREIQNKES